MRESMKIDEYLSEVLEPAQQQGMALEDRTIYDPKKFMNVYCRGLVTDPLRDQEARAFLEEIEIEWMMSPVMLGDFDLEAMDRENPREASRKGVVEEYHRSMAEGKWWFPSPFWQPSGMSTNGVTRRKAAEGVVDFIWSQHLSRELTTAEKALCYSKTNFANGERYTTNDKYNVCIKLHLDADVPLYEAAKIADIPGQGGSALLAHKLVTKYPWMEKRCSLSTLSRAAAYIDSKAAKAIDELGEEDWYWVVDNAGRLSHREGLSYETIPETYTPTQRVASLRRRIERDRAGASPIQAALTQADWWSRLGVTGGRKVFSSMTLEDRSRFTRGVLIQADVANLLVTEQEEANGSTGGSKWQLSGAEKTSTL